MDTPMIPDSGPDYQLTDPGGDMGGPPASHRVRRLLGFLLKYWWIPVLTLAVGLGAGIGSAFLQEPSFVSKASMWETLKLRLPDGELFSEDMQNFLGTQSELLRSDALRDLALARLRDATNTAPSIPVGKDGQPLPVAIQVTGSAKSSVFVIQATSSKPLFTQTFLNVLMQAYLEYRKNIRKEISGDTLASISELVAHWERDLNDAQDILSAFQRTNNLAIMEAEGTIAGGYLAKLETQLSDLQLENRLLEARAIELDAARQMATNTNADLPETTATSRAKLSVAAPGESQSSSGSQEIELLKYLRERLGRYLRPKHPKIVKLDADIQRAEKLQEIFRSQNRDQLTASRQANQLRMDNFLISIKQWQGKVVAANSRIAEAERLKLNVQRIQNVYDRLVLLVQNVGISRNIEQEFLAILQHASPPIRSYVREQRGLALALVGGLAVGLGIVFLISVRDDRITSVIEVNSTFGDAVVGLLPEVTQKGEVTLPLLELNDPRHIYAEAYRSLRSALLFLATEGERPKVLLVTSAMPNEGKSTVAANLARTLALSGSRVLLVDGDLRKGHLHLTLNLQSEPGLAELLHQTCDPEKVIQTDSLPNFAFVSRGTCSGNPGDLFLGSSLDAVLARWRQDYDYVVIDSSPLFAADDASCLAPKVDGTLFVVRSHYSSARAVREALNLLAQRQARVLGVIFNGADTSARSYYYYKHTDYHPTANSA
jgi:capsular exopolysaccharide synthesis family protein